MRMVVVVIVAAVAVGYGVTTFFVQRTSGDRASTARAAATGGTLWPFEIHRGYQGIKDLPVDDTKDPI